MHTKNDLIIDSADYCAMYYLTSYWGILSSDLTLVVGVIKSKKLDEIDNYY